MEELLQPEIIENAELLEVNALEAPAEECMDVSYSCGRCPPETTP